MTARSGSSFQDVLRIAVQGGRWTAVGVVLTLVALGLGMIQPLLVKHVIESAGTGPVLWKAIAILVLLFAAQALVETVVRYVLARTGEGVVLRVRLNLIDHLLRLHIRAYDKNRMGDLISRTTSDGAALRRAVAEGVADAVTGGVGMVGTLALMLWLDWTLFAVVAALVTVGGLILLGVLRGIRRASLIAQKATGEMTSDLERALSAIRTIRASQAEQRESDRLGSRATSVHAASVGLAKLDALVGPASALVVNGSFLVVLLVGGIRVADGRTSVADLVAFLLYLTYLTGPIAAAFQAVSTIQQGSAALQRINEVLALPRETDTAVRSSTAPQDSLRRRLNQVGPVCQCWNSVTCGSTTTGVDQCCAAFPLRFPAGAGSL